MENIRKKILIKYISNTFLNNSNINIEKNPK